ncbi:MAG: hypothetical protein HYX67_04240 [Candidatus Melainabacteria bacterium]|nr:hypothetical protein [Candidatus Melainabacteria bacterium]
MEEWKAKRSMANGSIRQRKLPLPVSRRKIGLFANWNPFVLCDAAKSQKCSIFRTPNNTVSSKTRTNGPHAIAATPICARTYSASMNPLGKVYWWMCQCKPYFWGDPSIAETMIKAVAYSKGYEVPRWKENLIPWEQVMEHPSVEVFAERFYSFFDGDWVKK